MATLKQTLFFYAKALTGISLASYGYLYYRCKKLREEAQDSELINAKKDSTRPQNVYYGLNWGYRSDNTIEKSLDTGDLLFFNYNCMNCFHPSDVVKCYLQQRQMNELDDPQNVAFCFRTPKKLFVVTSHFDGQVQIVPYHEFLNKPFIKTVKARTLNSLPVNIVENSAAFVQQIKEQSQRFDKQYSTIFTQQLKHKLLKYFIFDRIAVNTVPNYLYHIKVLNRHPMENGGVSVQELDQEQPECFFDAYDMSRPFMIRTYASQNLQKSNST